MHIGKFYQISCNTVLCRLFSSVNPLCLYVCIYTIIIIIIQARTQTFEKGDANLMFFTKGWGDANLKKILIFRPKLGV